MTYPPSSYPVDIYNGLRYFADTIYQIPNFMFNYTPPVGGFPTNSETEYDGIVWLDSNPQPAYQDLIDSARNIYEWTIRADFYGNWVTVEAQAGAAEPAGSLSSTLSSYLSTSSASTTYVAQTRTVNSHALSSNVILTADDVGDGTTNKAYTATEKTKLAGIATGATANSSDATLLNRANHTGTQAESTVVNLVSDLANRPTVYFGATLKANAIFYTASATVSSGTAIFQLTTDGTSTGTAIFPNGANLDSINAFVSDAAASYQMSYALTNSNKTLTVTANKLTTSNILTGVLGQASANSAVVRLTIWGS